MFIIPLIVAVVTQVIKIGLEIYRGTFNWTHAISYGGMPSSHAALATSLLYTLYYFEGIPSPTFAVALILFIVIIRDAMGYRYQIGIHGSILNRLIKELPDRQEYKFPIVSDRVGHTPVEVAVGIIIGFVGSMLLIGLYF